MAMFANSSQRQRFRRARRNWLKMLEIQCPGREGVTCSAPANEPGQMKGPPEGGPFVLPTTSLRVVALHLARLFRFLFGCHFGLRCVALAGVAALRRGRTRAAGLIGRLGEDGRREKGEGG